MRAPVRFIHFRFATENDELDAQIAKGQQGFWASHVEAIMGGRNGMALRYDDAVDRWDWTGLRIEWQREMIGTLRVKNMQQRRFLGFLQAHVVGKPYDMRCLAGVQYKVGSHEYQKWNCSDFIYLGLVTADIVHQIPPDLWHITPRDLMLLIGAIGALEIVI